MDQAYTAENTSAQKQDAVRKARAEIMHLAEPQDPVIHTAILIFGAVPVADCLAGRTAPQELKGPHTANDVLGNEGYQKLISDLTERARRWSPRTSRYNLEIEARTAARIGAWLCIPEDQDWPEQLEDLGPDAPYGLWGRGNRAWLSELTVDRCISVVGSRDTSSYGTSATTHIAGDLAANGKTIISGGAFGIDAVAHRSALATSTAILPTVALMACGIDRPYPKQNEALLNEIIDYGLLLSEVPLGYSPTRWRFLQRNRLIAALSAMTLVVEARWRSGALNTAHHALEIGREVRAVPGQIFSPSSEGCHRLIRDGLAGIATHAQDLLNALAPFDADQTEIRLDKEQLATEPDTFQLTEIQKRVWDSLPLRNPSSVENIATMVGTDARTVMLTLSQLTNLKLALQKNGGWTKQKQLYRSKNGLIE